MIALSQPSAQSDPLLVMPAAPVTQHDVLTLAIDGFVIAREGLTALEHTRDLLRAAVADCSRLLEVAPPIDAD